MRKLGKYSPTGGHGNVFHYFYAVILTVFAENGGLPLLAATDWSSPLLHVGVSKCWAKVYKKRWLFRYGCRIAKAGEDLCQGSY